MADVPIDLSRRCDSVETRKTPSPYSSSAFDSSPQNSLNDSPTSSHSGSSAQNHRHHADTPTNHYNSIEYMQSRFVLPKFAYQTKHELNTSELSPESIYHMQQSPIGNGGFLLDVDQIQHLDMQQKLLGNKIPSMELMKQTSRPFKAYQENSFFTDIVLDENYSHFRDQTLDAIRQRNGGQLTVSNPKMSRIRQTQQYNDESTLIETTKIDTTKNQSSIGPIKDSTYYERRRKNNEAAKKSRDRRRQKEDELALRTAYLEQENMMLKVQLATVKKQLEHFLANQRKSP